MADPKPKCISAILYTMKQVQETVKRQTLGIYIGKAAPDAMRPRLGPGSARPGPRSVLYINDYILFFITIYVRSTYSACIHTQSVLHTYDGSGDLFSSHTLVTEQQRVQRSAWAGGPITNYITCIHKDICTL